MTDAKLWKVFSLYIRLRDAEPFTGVCRCFTCGGMHHFKKMDAGHGIPRQHKATKFDERNNHSQCANCNWAEGGKREVYKEEVNKRYGPQTWEKLEVMSRMTCKRDQYEINVMTEFYKKEVQKLRKLKHL